MKLPPTFSRFTIPLLCLGLILGIGGPILDVVPTAEAAPSRLVKRLKKKIRQLKRQLRIAPAPNPAPPTPAPPTPGMVQIPAGTFQMGDETNGTGSGDPNELPLHFVTLSGFSIDKYEVTKELWDAVAAWGAGNGYTDLPVGGGQGAHHPVHSINWYDAVKWCNARSEMDGLAPAYFTNATRTTVYRTGEIDLAENFVKWTANGFRLATEAEWEYAARGGVAGNAYPWGNSIDDSDANYSNSGDPFEVVIVGVDGTPSTPVGFYDGGQLPPGPNRANAFGLHDVAGNVFEFCWDYFDAAYYATSPSSNPKGPAAPGNRVLRGGSAVVGANDARCASRFELAPSLPSIHIGFRTVRRN